MSIMNTQYTFTVEKVNYNLSNYTDTFLFVSFSFAKQDLIDDDDDDNTFLHV